MTRADTPSSACDPGWLERQLHTLHTAGDIAMIQAEVRMQAHIRETWPAVVEALQEVLDQIDHPSGIELADLEAAAARARPVLSRAKGGPA